MEPWITSQRSPRLISSASSALDRDEPLSFRPSSPIHAWWHLGDFKIGYAQGRVLVQNGSSTLWSSLASIPLISASKSHDVVTGASGCWSIKQHDSGRCLGGAPDETSQPSPETVLFQGNFSAPCASMRWRMSFSLETGAFALRFNVSLEKTLPGYDRVLLTYARHPSERVFGFGQQYTLLNAAGSLIPIFSREQGVGRGLQPITAALNARGKNAGGDDRTTYSAVPHYATSQLRSLHLLNSEPCWFDLRSDGRLSIEVAATSLVGRLFGASTALELLERASTFTGRMQALPDWAHAGAVVGIQGGTSRVAKVGPTPRLPFRAAYLSADRCALACATPLRRSRPGCLPPT